MVQRFLVATLISLVVQSWGSTQHPRRQRSRSLLHRSDSPKRSSLASTSQKSRAGGDKSVAQILTSVDEYIKRLKAEQAAGESKAKDRSTQCTATSIELRKLLEAGEKTASEARQDLDKINAEVGLLETETSATKDKIRELDVEIDDLIERLKVLRKEHKEQQAQSKGSLQQVQAVIVKNKLRGRSERQRAALLGKERDVQVRFLGELDAQLASQAISKPVALLQQASSSALHHRKGRHAHDQSDADIKLLQDDKARLQKAVVEADKSFDEEEKELIDLIELKREELQKMEARLRTQQPNLADVLKQASETNRTLGGALRSTARDKLMLSQSEEKCTLTVSIWDEEKGLRFALMGSLRMAKVFLQKMDSSSFLAKDMQSLSVTQTAPAAEPAPLPLAFLQEEATEETASGSGATSASVVTSAGAFDEVSRMIQGLITSLREQANGDMDKHQFCNENKAKNRKMSRDVSNAIDAKGAEIRWAEMAMARLDDEISFLKTEASRLEAAAKAIGEEFRAEESRVQSEAEGRNAAAKSALDSIEMLTQLCGLDSGGAALLEVASGKNSSCQQAAELMRQSHGQIQKLQSAAAANLEKLRTLFTNVQRSTTEAAEARKADLLAAKVARGRRNDEFTVAKGELQAKRNDLALLEKAKKELETNCGPGQESHEERAQRRQEEIDALKNALNVLSGEAVPTMSGDSLLETGEQ
eukprot:TRINITY_DN4014_c0_g1_i1.p1 TRINITY_DN4014_c0_g1~~TRINITY_DN4014_c0_g1_i1.p1  ORF type:complete len:704 (+),score=182.77 TRINITY_DN4014_c0_g1_i1:139-2250(+)